MGNTKFNFLISFYFARTVKLSTNRLKNMVSQNLAHNFCRSDSFKYSFLIESSMNGLNGIDCPVKLEMLMKYLFFLKKVRRFLVILIFAFWFI